MKTETEIRTLFKSYLICKKFLHSEEYAKEYFNQDGAGILAEKEQYEARMNVIESLIRYIEPSDEYTILRLHYICGVSVEKCAECMSVSRRTAFRMLNKAIKSICELVNKKGGE